MSENQDQAYAKLNDGGRIFSTGGIARLVGVSQNTVIRECDRGNLVCYRVPGSKFRRITRAELVAWAERGGLPLRLPELATETHTEGNPDDAGTGDTEGGAGNSGQTPGQQEPGGGGTSDRPEDGLQPAAAVG